MAQPGTRNRAHTAAFKVAGTFLVANVNRGRRPA